MCFLHNTNSGSRHFHLLWYHLLFCSSIFNFHSRNKLNLMSTYLCPLRNRNRGRGFFFLLFVHSTRGVCAKHSTGIEHKYIVIVTVPHTHIERISGLVAGPSIFFPNITKSELHRQIIYDVVPTCGNSVNNWQHQSYRPVRCCVFVWSKKDSIELWPMGRGKTGRLVDENAMYLINM